MIFQCKDVPKKIHSSKPVKKCNKKPKEKCHSVPKTVPVKKCYHVPKQHCESVPVKNPVTIPKKQCWDVKAKHCHTVPVKKPRTVVKKVPKVACVEKGNLVSCGFTNCFMLQVMIIMITMIMDTMITMIMDMMITMIMDMMITMIMDMTMGMENIMDMMIINIQLVGIKIMEEGTPITEEMIKKHIENMSLFTMKILTLSIQKKCQSRFRVLKKEISFNCSQNMVFHEIYFNHKITFKILDDWFEKRSDKKSSFDYQKHIDLVQTTAYNGKGFRGSFENIDYERKALNLNEEMLSQLSDDDIGDSYDYVSASYLEDMY